MRLPKRTTILCGLFLVKISSCKEAQFIQLLVFDFWWTLDEFNLETSITRNMGNVLVSTRINGDESGHEEEQISSLEVIISLGILIFASYMTYITFVTLYNSPLGILILVCIGMVGAILLYLSFRKYNILRIRFDKYNSLSSLIWLCNHQNKSKVSGRLELSSLLLPMLSQLTWIAYYPVLEVLGREVGSS